MIGVWAPKRTPLPISALASLPPESRARFESEFERATDVQCHLWTAAARRESAVVVAARRSGALTGLMLVAEPAGHEVAASEGASGRELRVETDGWSLTVVEPRSDAREIAASVAAERGRCAFVDVTSYETIRTRVFAPFRDAPLPDAATLRPRFEAELERMADEGLTAEIRYANRVPEHVESPSVCVFSDGWEHSGLVARAAAATDGPWHEASCVVLFARDWREVLLAHVVARRVTLGALDADGVAETESAAEVAAWLARLEGSEAPEEHAAYGLVAGLGMNRGNAVAVVRGARG